jgi:ribosomal protein S18 acetylase RimI-like enzyme
VECLYFLAAGDDPATWRVAAESGYEPMDLRVEFSQRPPAGRGSSTLRDATEDDLPALRAIAGSSHRDTRFYADPRFPDGRCDALYRTWIERSFEGWAEATLVAGDVDGYVTCHIDDARKRGSIGLIAVDEPARGRGLGAALIDGALEWMRGRGLDEASVATQGRNVAAQRAFQRGGFRTESIGLWFHRWYDR